jgi:hypothetical protein
MGWGQRGATMLATCRDAKETQLHVLMKDAPQADDDNLEPHWRFRKKIPKKDSEKKIPANFDLT